MNRETGRLIDANLNRAAEGLRVAEDLARYLLDAPGIQQELKTLRHRLSASLGPCRDLACRDAAGDVGFAAVGKLEDCRPDHAALAAANLKRAQEALRVLEEVLKLSDPARAREMKGLRYAAYDLERDLVPALSRPRLPRGLYLVLTAPVQGYEQLTRLAVEADIAAVQLRCKTESLGQALEIARRLREITRGTDTLLIINDRPDIALLAEADGLHVGQDDLPPREARKLVGPRMLLGLSTHNLDQVRAAASEPVDYIGFGPVYPTNSKDVPDPVIGVERLTDAVECSPRPVVAIGGIDAANLPAVCAARPHNAAVIRSVTEARDPAALMQALHSRILEENI